MKFILAATFKSNKTTLEVEDWLQKITPEVKKSKAQVVVAPSFPHLHLFSKSRHTNSNIRLSAQNVSPFPPGSYTGEVNATQLKDLGVAYCIVGHSERREYFHETHSEIANKVVELLEQDITPILCLREADIIPQISALREDQVDQVVYCFEPPGSIGGTEAASNKEIQKVLDAIKQEAGTNVSIMYGGSVNAGNLSTLLQLDIAGVLVSTASLDSSSFAQIIHELDHIKG